jgi:hypothetical protein
LPLIGNAQLTERSENVAFSATFLPRGATFNTAWFGSNSFISDAKRSHPSGLVDFISAIPAAAQNDRLEPPHRGCLSEGLVADM